MNFVVGEEYILCPSGIQYGDKRKVKCIAVDATNYKGTLKFEVTRDNHWYLSLNPNDEWYYAKYIEYKETYKPFKLRLP